MVLFHSDVHWIKIGPVDAAIRLTKDLSSWGMSEKSRPSKLTSNRAITSAARVQPRTLSERRVNP